MLYVSAGFQVFAYLRAGQHIVSSMYVMELMLFWVGWLYIANKFATKKKKKKKKMLPPYSLRPQGEKN